LEEVTSSSHTLNFAAEPVDPDDPTSPWLTARKGALRAVHKLLGKSDYTAHAGVYTGGANAVYWVEIVAKRPDGLVVVRNITEGAKRKVPEVTAPIEPDLLYPLLRGRDVQRWGAEPSAHIVVPHTKDTGWQAIGEKELQAQYPLSFAYFNRFKEVLLSRVAYNLLRQGHPFYILKDISAYTFTPWKVVWLGFGARTMKVAVVGRVDGKPVMSNQAMHPFIPLEHEDEAHYVCASMNSAPFECAVRAHTQEGGKSFAQSNILDHVYIPKYDPADPVHRALAEASKEAHEAAAQGDEPRLREIEKQVDTLAAKLWNLSDKELAEIHRSLAELEARGK